MRLTLTVARSAALAGIYWGAIWGLYEATVGYLTHSFLRVPGTSAILLVPFAVFCMLSAMNAGGGSRAAIVAAATAAAIKLLNLLLPVPTLVSVLNPALAIVLEGLAFAVVVHGFDVRHRLLSPLRLIAAALTFNAIWRGVFIVWSAGLASGWSTGMLRDGFHAPASFLVRDTLTSSVMIVAVLLLAHRAGWRADRNRAAPDPLVTGAVLLAAMAAEVGTRLIG